MYSNFVDSLRPIGPDTDGGTTGWFWLDVVPVL
jgi:hypothetical protein